MAKGVKPRVKVPKTASAGEMVTLKTLISHKMESGQRKDSDGNKIPRSIINRFVCAFNGKTVVDVEMLPAISTNPYFQFDASSISNCVVRFGTHISFSFLSYLEVWFWFVGIL